MSIPAGEFGIDGSRMNFVDKTPVARVTAGLSNLSDVDAKLMRWFNLVATAAVLSVIGAIVVMVGVIVAQGAFSYVMYGIWPFFLVLWAYIAVTKRNMKLVQIYGWVVFILSCLQVFFFYSYGQVVADNFKLASEVAKLPDGTKYSGPSAGQLYVFAAAIMINFLFALAYWILMIVSSIWAINMTSGGGATTGAIIAPGEKQNYGAV